MPNWAPFHGTITGDTDNIFRIYMDWKSRCIKRTNDYGREYLADIFNALRPMPEASLEKLKDPKFEKFLKPYKGDGRFASFLNGWQYKMPAFCLETEYNDPEIQVQLELSRLLRKTGNAFDWYEWCNLHWDTKWDIGTDECEFYIEHSPKGTSTITLTGQTAWSAPGAFFQYIYTRFCDEVENLQVEMIGYDLADDWIMMVKDDLRGVNDSPTAKDWINAGAWEVGGNVVALIPDKDGYCDVNGRVVLRKIDGSYFTKGGYNFAEHEDYEGIIGHYEGYDLCWEFEAEDLEIIMQRAPRAKRA